MRGPEPRKDIDWEAIQSEYRAGLLSVRQIGRLHGVSHTLINRRVKKHPNQWKRDLSKRVRVAIARKIVTTAVSDDDVSTLGTEDEIVEAAAERSIQVIREHKKSIMALAQLEAKLMTELNDTPKKEWIGQYQGKILTKTVDITATEKLTALHALASAQEKRIRLERQAFGIAEESKPDADEITGIIIEAVASTTGGEHG